jgi:hypothetical protein
LALSSAARELAERAAGEVPTVSDRWGEPHEYVEQAATLVSLAQDLLRHAVVYARERGGSWTDVGDGLGISKQTAHERFAPAYQSWESALDEPWVQSGSLRSSRLPEGADRPDEAAASLDRWCARNTALLGSVADRAQQTGHAERMVSAELPRHTGLTEAASVIRQAKHLGARSEPPSQAELDAFAARKHAVLAQDHPDVDPTR